MTTITKVIRTLPAAPNSAFPATFEVDADAFVAQLPGFGTDQNTMASQMNTVAEEVNANAGAAAQSLAATNTATVTATQKAIDAATAAAAATNAANVNGTSTTSLTPTLGQNNNFVYVETGRTPFVGMRMRAVSRAAPANNFALGYVTTWDAGTRTLSLAVDVVSAFPAAAADWNLMLEGQPGEPGAEVDVLMPARVVGANSVLLNTDNGKHIDCTAALTLTIGAGIDPGWGVIVNALGFDVTINATFNDASITQVVRRRSSGLLSFNGSVYRLARMGQAPAGLKVLTANGTLLSTDAGASVFYNAATPGTITLPAANAVPANTAIALSNIGNGLATVLAANTNLIFAFGAAGQASIKLGSGVSVSLVSDGVNWLAISGSAPKKKTMQDVSASRALSTTYTNTTEQVIDVYVYGSTNQDGAYLSAVIGAFNGPETKTVIYSALGFYFFVPPGSTYRVNGAGMATIFWTEYRE